MSDDKKILKLRLTREMWIIDYAIDVHLRNLIATYGIEAVAQSMDRMIFDEPEQLKEAK